MKSLVHFIQIVKMTLTFSKSNPKTTPNYQILINLIIPFFPSHATATTTPTNPAKNAHNLAITLAGQAGQTVTQLVASVQNTEIARYTHKSIYQE